LRKKGGLHPVWKVSDKKLLEAGIDNVRKLQPQVEEELNGVRKGLDALYNDGKLRVWAREELEYFEKEIAVLQSVVDDLTSLGHKLSAKQDEHRHIHQGLPYTRVTSHTSRRKREVKKKEGRRKRNQQENSAHQVLQM
jgi:hypothetical protein